MNHSTQITCFFFSFNTTKGSKTKVVSFAFDSIGHNGGGPEDSNHGNKINLLKNGFYFETPLYFFPLSFFSCMVFGLSCYIYFTFMGAVQKRNTW